MDINIVFQCECVREINIAMRVMVDGPDGAAAMHVQCISTALRRALTSFCWPLRALRSFIHPPKHEMKMKWPLEMRTNSPELERIKQINMHKIVHKFRQKYNKKCFRSFFLFFSREEWAWMKKMRSDYCLCALACVRPYFARVAV